MISFLSKKYLFRLPLFAGLIAQANAQQLSISISPTNAPPDPLTSIKASASLTGSLAGATAVRFNVWRDFNANGNVDSGEPLLASYDVPNNSDYKIGGVRNDNRPWDLDPSPSVVQAEVGRGIFNLVNIWAGDFVVTAAKTTTPTSQVRARFKLSLPAKNQRIRGTVRDSTGAVVPRNAIVVFETLNSLKTFIVSTDSSGNYDAPLDPGDYQVGIYSAMGNVYNDHPATNSSILSLKSGQTLTRNLNLLKISIPKNISGVALDTSNNPLRGLLLEANNNTSQRQYLTFTGQNGEFLLPVDGGIWELRTVFGLSAKGLVGFDDELMKPSATITNTSGPVSNPRPILATAADAMMKLSFRAPDNRSMEGLSLSFYGSDLDAEFRLNNTNSVCLASKAGFYTLDLDWSEEGFINPERPEIELKIGPTPLAGPFTIDLADLYVRARFLSPLGAPVPNQEISAENENYSIVAESRTFADGNFFLNLGSGENLYLTQGIGHDDPPPTHIFLGAWLTNGLKGNVNLGDFRGIPLDHKVRIVPVDGRTGLALSGNRLSRSLAPGMWIEANLGSLDFGILWGCRQISSRGGPDDIRHNNINRLNLIKTVLSERKIQDFFNTNSAAHYTFRWPSSLNVPSNTPTRIARTEFNELFNYSNWASHPRGNLITQSLPAGVSRSFYEFPVALATNHPLLSSGLSWGFNYSGGSSLKNLVICDWNSLYPSNMISKITNGVLVWKMPVRDVSYSNAIHVTYVDASNRPIGGKWVSYSIDEWNDVNPNTEYQGMMNYSSGSSTGLDGSIVLPAYDNGREWCVLDWGTYPYAINYVRAKPGTNRVVLRRTTNIPSQASTSVSPSGRGPGQVLVLTGSALETVGGLDGFSICTTNNESGWDLRVVGRTYATNATGASTVQLGLSSALTNGTYRIKMNPRFWSANTNVFTTNFVISGTSQNVVTRSNGTIRIIGKYFGKDAGVELKQGGAWKWSDYQPFVSDDGTTISFPAPNPPLPPGSYQIYYNEGGFQGLLGNLSL